MVDHEVRKYRFEFLGLQASAGDVFLVESIMTYVEVFQLSHFFY